MSAPAPNPSEDRAVRGVDGQDVLRSGDMTIHNGVAGKDTDNNAAIPTSFGAPLDVAPETSNFMPKVEGGEIINPAHTVPGTGDDKKPEATGSRTRRLAKWGLSRTAGDGKAVQPGPSEQQGQQPVKGIKETEKKPERIDRLARKAGPAKLEEPKPEETSDLRIVYPADTSNFVPRVDIVAIHDIDETLSKAFVYRKKQKRRGLDPRDSRAPFPSAGIISQDGEYGLGTAGTPGLSRSKAKYGPSSSITRKKVAPEPSWFMQQWLKDPGPGVGSSVDPSADGQGLPSRPNSSPAPRPSSAPGDDSQEPTFFQEIMLEEESPFGLPSVPEYERASPFGDTHSETSRRPVHRMSTFEKKKPGNRISALIEEERVSSVGDLGERRRILLDVQSDRQSSIDPSTEKRVNWLTDLDMLPSQIPGARVMCYTYKGVEKVAEPWEYLTKLAQDMVSRLVQKRTSDTIDYGRVPIVFIGNGFGALIVERAMIRLAVETRENQDATTGFLKVASLVLLDAPAAGPEKDVFPRSRSQEAKKAWTQDWMGKARTASGAQSHKIDVYSMWNRLSRFLSAYSKPVIWHHGSATVVKEKNSEALLIMKQSLTSHRLSRFEGPGDIDYRAIVDQIKRSLVALCSVAKSDMLTQCLPDFLKDKFPVDLRDHLGRTVLHLAVGAGNPEAVRRLLYQGNASVTKKDKGGRSALNIAVQEAAHLTFECGGNIDPAREKAFTQIINLLIKNGSRLDDRDNDGRTPWAYAEGEGNQWIRRLKDKHLVIGSSSSATPAVDTVRMPDPGPQMEACKAYDMILAEVFLQKKKEKFSEVFNFEIPSVFDAIYRGNGNVGTILKNARPENLTADRVRCRWIHVPANNEQWIHDLLISMDIHDASLGGQRHEGSRLIDRYMLPQARRYKHFYTTVATKTQPETKPKATRYNSTDSGATIILKADELPPTPVDNRDYQRLKHGKPVPSPGPEIVRTEADAIVIYMPILGFERHRHRKFLTHAFRKADRAMRIANARESSPDSKVRRRLNPKDNRNDDQSIVTSSDDGESSDAKETSRLYPLETPVLHAIEVADRGRDVQLLRGYLDSKKVKPVHCRRTLDQFSYYMLSSTEARDKSQVGYRWAMDKSICPHPKNRPIVMVDQLWAWAFHDGTVITSSPSTWDSQEEFNFSRVVVRELKENKDRPIIKSAEDLLHLVLRTGVDFFRRKGPSNFQFHECFQSSINNVSEKQGQLFDSFRQTTKRLQRGTLAPEERKRQIDTLFSLDEETELLVEIMDIQDELNIVKNVLTQQKDVLNKLLSLYPKTSNNAAGDDEPTVQGTGLGKGELLVLQNLVQLLRDQTTPLNNNTPAPSSLDLQSHRRADSRGKGKDGEPPYQTSSAPAKGTKKGILQNMDLMLETMGIVDNNMRIVNDMLDYAEKVESSLENLLDLKQKHANGWEARFAREGSEESQRQGNIILVFTLVTVVFLPLSFITSFFTLEADAFPKHPETQENLWPLSLVSAYIFGISAAISIPLIALALYVNKLIAWAKDFYFQAMNAIQSPDAALHPNLDDSDMDHDSDKEETYKGAPSSSRSDDLYGSNKQRLGSLRSKSAKRLSGKHDSDSSLSDDSSTMRTKGRYAPLLGIWRFHEHIPYLRNLWRRRRYRVRHARWQNNHWKDSYEIDYPLRRLRKQVRGWTVRRIVELLAWLGSKKHKRARDKERRRKRKEEERRKRREAGGDSTTSSSSGESHSDGSDSELSRGVAAGAREKVDKRDFAKRLDRLARKRQARKNPKKASSLSGSWERPPSRGLSDEPWDGQALDELSNKTRSRGSRPDMSVFDEEGFESSWRGDGDMDEKAKARWDRLSWLRLRRSLRDRERAAPVDEEKEIGGRRSGKGLTGTANRFE